MAREPERRSFRYEPRTRDDLRERANARGGGFDSFVKSQYKLYKVRDGKNLLRVLPPTWPKARHYGYDIWVNYSIGVDNQSYLSLSKMKNEPDPLAEARREAEREGDKKLIAALQPRQRILMWVIDRNDEEEGPQLWAAPFTVDKALANISFDEDTKEVVYIDDPQNGCDVRFYREGTGLTTKYPAEKMKLQKPSPLHEDTEIEGEWLAFVSENPIPDCLQYYDYKHINETFNGQAGRPDDDEETEAVPPRRAMNDKRPGKPWDDDEVETVQPRRRRDLEDEADATPRRRPADPDDKAPPARRRVAEPEPVEDDPPARSRSRLRDEEPAEEAPPARESIRERLARRRGGAAKPAAEDDD